ncbi:MAG: biotin carboxylase N-terminal domain-containing protein [Candidatus Thalassarchaeaceae archaeon]|jgi:acetyl-CoA carboxylase biotin carboxylase subunit|nr:biotin carboxylase N-terminal domain-containing protein [Candidatus Thalassarchaeaceae archaeon]MDP6318080.1 biotin carboxylase N-terminal domain-containing protein [Candidatus Thalassarchaeaceae archaeon]DAC34258.1 MAG TPA: ATP-grasp domain-containing protein [Candidatus Poseidoniales archaeon]HIH80413.1 ATP-grasp domain-containing protein [Candidatus Thalassarchaeaceae archaeon]HJM29563.1 biotin carboxylase N-terminal domain-containing protein [Candidatus Thalassarchaeaceae archaeon]|tara:strand:+ start:722 stop:2059 length:1338 start_codon:yes stop_codon:yes gene_type:complete
MFRRVLIANRGEIALRILRSLRTLGIEAVMIHGREDRLSTPVRLADEAIHIARDDPLASYLDIEAIVAAAKEVGADAVHPGYGFLAENPVFAERLEQEGITFIGPSSKVLRLLGDKITAREAMSRAGLPIAQGSPGPISDPKEATDIAKQIGFPVIIKAAAGGGGIGMQVVQKQEEFESALKLCQGRALSAFGDDRVFLEKFIEGAQHIEFQVLGDGTRAVHFGERFCSIQRRHQKILEEGPWLTEEVREDIGNRVVAGAEAVGYKGLATFEFLRDSSGEFYFLEVNPRVQVEHTVTEMITGFDLVSLGIRIASGENLPLLQSDISISGHAIQARLNAENPRTLEPSPGRLWECHWPSGPGVRVDSHAHTGYDMPPSFDSLLAKLIVWGRDRDEAVRRLDAALSETLILGVDTLIPLHRAILSEEDFRNRDVTITYLEEHAELLE